MDPRIAFLITSMLSDNASRTGDFGGCNPLYLASYTGSKNTHYTFGDAYASGQCAYLRSHRYLSPDVWPTAAKTGAAQDFTNDWTIGYTMDHTGAVWVGNNDDSPMHNIDGVSGAAPIWYSSMLYAEEATGRARTPFPVPRGVHLAAYYSHGVRTTDWLLNDTTPPANIGASAFSVPCVALNPNGGCSLSHHKCQVTARPPRAAERRRAARNQLRRRSLTGSYPVISTSFGYFRSGEVIGANTLSSDVSITERLCPYVSATIT